MNYVRKTYSQIRMQHLMQLFLQLIFPMTMHIDKFKCFKYEATHTPKYTDMHHIIFHIYTFFVILNENKESLCLSGGAECLYFCECTNSKLVSPWWFISLSISGSRGAEKDVWFILWLWYTGYNIYIYDVTKPLHTTIGHWWPYLSLRSCVLCLTTHLLSIERADWSM